MIPSLLLESLLDALPPHLYLRWYVPENATLFIVGDIDEEETIREAGDADGAEEISQAA